MEAATTSYSYLPVRTRRSFAFLRYLAVKRHSVVASRTKVGTAAGDDTQEQNETVSTSRAAFVAGLPYGLHRPEVLKQLFETFGDVKDVAVHHKQTSALVVFQEDSSLNDLLTAANNGNILEFFPPEQEIPFGLKGWVEEHKSRYPGREVLKEQIEEFWQAHQQEEEQKKARRAAAMTDDGWTLVTRNKGRKKNKDAAGTAVAGASAAAAAERAQRQSQGLDNFYRFQAREKRRDELLELRTKFQQDKKRIADLRAQRRFRPY